MTASRRSAARLIVDALLANGVDTLFTVPGESFLDLLDAAYDVGDGLRVVTCRHEGGAAFMAEAYGKATGRPAALAVSRGPGAANAAIGIHTARQDSTPLLVVVGQVPCRFRGREAFQEIDIATMFAPIAGWAREVDGTGAVLHALAEAFAHAVGHATGRPGPALLSVPEDVFAQTAMANGAVGVAVSPPAPRAPARADLDRLLDLLSAARRPLVIVGGNGWSAEACADMRHFLERFALPAATSFRRQDRLDNVSPSYVGCLTVGMEPSLAAAVRDADLIFAVATRLGEVATAGYELVVAPRPRQTLVHVHADAGELGRVFATDLAIHADPAPTARALAALAAPADRPWRRWRNELRAGYDASLVPGPAVGAVDLGAIAAALNDHLPADAFVCTDAGNFAGWVQRYYRFGRYPSQLGPANGAMGYGVPAAVAAKLADPARPAVSFVGDGGALMTGAELATAIAHGLDPVIVIVNNDSYGTIRMHQELRYPERVIASGLTNPDFVAWGASFGAHTERVTATEAFAPALARGLAAGRAAVIEVVTDVEQITSRTTITDLRREAREAAP